MKEIVDRLAEIVEIADEDWLEMGNNPSLMNKLGHYAIFGAHKVTYEAIKFSKNVVENLGTGIGEYERIGEEGDSEINKKLSGLWRH